MKLLPTKYALLVLLFLFLFFSIANTVDFFAFEASQTWMYVLSAQVALLFIVDMTIFYRQRRSYQLSIFRQTPRYFIVNQKAKITLTVTNTGRRKISLRLFDHVPETFSFLEIKKGITMPLSIRLSRSETATIAYQVKPQRRGQSTFAGVQIRIDSPMRLWQYDQFFKVESTTKVYPDFRKIEQEDLLSDVGRQQGNLIKQRQRGSGTDFAQLRDYRMGDRLSIIDHKASARFDKLISKEYQIERDQQVMILLDCSRRLRLFQGELSHFDYALNSVVFLARSVLHQGDSVGLMSFGNQESRHIKPQRGLSSVNTILNAIYDLQTSRQTPDYIEAAQRLMMHQKKRCLVIVLTSLQEEDTQTIKRMLQILQKKHVVIIANLKANILGEEMTIRDLDDAVFYAARETYNTFRDKMLKQIGGKKLTLLDVYPPSLTARLINLYLNIKKSGGF